MKTWLARAMAKWLGDDWSADSALRFAVQHLIEFKGPALFVAALSCGTAVLEGGSLAVVMFGVRVLTAPTVDEALNSLGRVGGWVRPLAAGHSTLEVFTGFVAAGVLLQALRSATSYGTAVAGIYLQNRIARTAIVRGYERVLALDFRTIVQQRGGEISFKAATMPTLAAVVQLIVSAIQAVTILAAYTLLLLLFAPAFALLVVIGAPALSLLMGFTHRKIRGYSENYVKLQQQLSHVGLELFQSFRLIHTHATWDLTLKQMHDLIEPAYLTRRKSEVVAAIIGPLFEIVLIAGIAVLMMSVVYYSDRPAAQALGGALLGIMAVYRAMPWANALNSVRAGLAQNLPPLRRSATLFNDKSLAFRPAAQTPLREPVHRVCFDAVSYVYPGTDTAAVSDVSFDLPAGGCVALVGPSGSGKSTLTDLFIGLRLPTTGRVLVNGQSLAGIDQASWRGRLGVVSQDTFLFSTSLRENITYGFELDDARLRHAARLAHVEEFVRELPEGYETQVGDHGYRLSGGQRQRLALARALYRRPDILILDEATSALDSESERVVQAAIEESIGAGLTTVMVAHRLSTVARADEILVLDHGRVIERGRHLDLLERGGMYARLWAIQSLTEKRAEVEGAGLPRPEATIIS